MGRNYKTSNQGIAAYLLSQGYSITRTEKGKTKAGKDCIFLEFNIDATEGREMGDAFFKGDVNGNLKDFHDHGYTVRNRIYEARKEES